MLRSRLLPFAKCVLLAPALLVLNGCLIPGDDDSSGPSRGNLSSAMQASADGGGSVSGSRSSDGSLDAGGSFGGGGWGGGGAGIGAAMIDYDKSDRFHFQVPVDVSYSVSLNGPIKSMTRFDLTPISYETDAVFFGFYVGGNTVELVPGSLADQGVDHIWALESGFAFRFYLAPAHTFINPYVAGNLNGELLSWDYRHGVVSGSDVIHDDSLTGVGGYAGLGIAIKRNSPVSFFAEVGFGGTIWNTQTREHFDNDVFSAYGYFNVKAGMTIKF